MPTAGVASRSPDRTGLRARRAWPPASWLSAGCRRFILDRLTDFENASLQIEDHAGCVAVGRAPGSAALRAQIKVHDPSAYRRIVFGGSIGAAEAFVDGLWSSPDLTAVIRLFARHRSLAERLDTRASALARAAHGWWHRWRANTLHRSRSNIRAHYDLGNDFFAAFLDPTLSYSCAYFEHDDAGLDEASRYKLDLVCRKLDLRPTDAVLEIGGGWGGFAVHAAARCGCHVTTTTLSAEQARYARERAERAGLADRVTVLELDYRELGRHLGRRFDKLVSVEMIEAVGRRYLPRYFDACASLVKPTGRMLLQAIVIADELYEEYARAVDFIQRYVFPGGFLPSMRAIRSHVGSTGLSILHSEDLTLHYARTLRAWRDRFETARDRLRRAGYPDPLLRTWEYYFSYCEGGFLERTIGAHQIVLAGPRAEASTC